MIQHFMTFAALHLASSFGEYSSMMEVWRVLVFNNKTYTVSDDIQYKKNKEKTGEITYSILWNHQTLHLKDITAVLFDRLLSFEATGLFEDCDKLVNHEENNLGVKHLINMIFINFLSSKWLKETDPDETFEFELSPYTYLAKPQGQPYLINFLYNTFDMVSSELYDQLVNNQLVEIDSKELFYLYTRRHVKRKGQTENIGFADGTQKESIVYLIFSYTCNLRCIYCFEREQNRHYQMDETTLAKSLEYIERLADACKVNLTFYGGEPLLEANISRLNKVIRRFGNHKNIRFRFITNGINVHKFLDVFNSIKSSLDKFVITLDGTRKIHDQRRVFDNSEGTFDLILHNIGLLSDLGYRVSIRINVDYSNYDVQEELLFFLNKELNGKENVTIEYHRIEDKKNNDFVPVSYPDCYRLYLKAKEISHYKIKFNVPVLVALENLSEHEQGFADLCNSCCSMNRNHVIDWDGNIYSCNEAMGMEEFKTSSVNEVAGNAPKKIKKSYCSSPFFFAYFCNCSLTKQYTGYGICCEKEKNEYKQIEELVHYFLENKK